MHEILIISGKGGTGKTSVTAAFAHICEDAVICDLDVDAPDLHLILQPKPRQTTEFISGFEPRVVTEKCTSCGTCEQMCRFDAIQVGDEGAVVDPIRCEGCGVCVYFCPEKAIDFIPKHCGDWSISDTRFGTMAHAQLFPGEENSGKLVALLRTKARELAASEGASMILADGPPGIGCPVISALSGTNLAVMVTEPTPSGIHDLERVVELCDYFKIPTSVIINKCDLNETIAGDIRTFCDKKGICVLGELPHDPDFVNAMVQARAITEFSQGPTSRKLREAWQKLLQQAAELKAA